jgi:hypothetical protein
MRDFFEGRTFRPKRLRWSQLWEELEMNKGRIPSRQFGEGQELSMSEELKGSYCSFRGQGEGFCEMRVKARPGGSS